MVQVSMQEVLAAAQKNNVAIAAINVSNMETIAAVMAAADHCRSPVILQVSPLQCEAQKISYHEILEMAQILSKRYQNGCYVLHQDHGGSFQDCIKALQDGFRSIMFDGALLPFEENIALTAKVRAQDKNFSLEAELGILTQECGEQTELTEEAYTNPNQVAEFVQRTKVDSLAVSIGNAHGLYRWPPKLRFDILEQIAQECNVPLVLHGASGIGKDEIQMAIAKGIRKINFFTELDRSYMNKFAELAAQNVYMMKAAGAAQEAMCSKAVQLIELCTGGKIKC